MSRRSHGLRAWIWQRSSAVYMATYLLIFLVWLMLAPPLTWTDWRALMANAAVNLATGLFLLALLLHAWVGARDVIIDYVHGLVPRLGLLAATALMLAGSGLWALKVLYGLY